MMTILKYNLLAMATILVELWYQAENDFDAIHLQPLGSFDLLQS